MKLKNKKFAVVVVLLVVVLTFGLVSALSPLVEQWYLRVDSYRDICVHEAYAIITYQSYRFPFILDVRSEGEFDGTLSPGHIAGATNIEWTVLEANLSEPASCPLIGHEGDTIIVYCKTGGRSANASEVLALHGFEIVYNMVGGIDMWTYSGYPVVTEAPPTYTDITVHEAWSMIDSGAYPDLIILDVRDPAVYATEHIEDAINIPYDADFGTNLGPLSGHEYHEIIVYCMNLDCPKSPLACQILVDNGFTKVYNMFEGIDEWKAQGYPVWTPPPSENVLPNPSAEDDSNVDGIPDYWAQHKHPDVTGSWDWSTTSYDGLRSLEVTIQPGGSAANVIQWRQYHDLDSPDSPFSRGSTYRLRVWYQTDLATMTIYVGMWDSGHSWLASAFVDRLVESASPSTWEQSSWITFTVPTNARYIALGMAIRVRDIDSGASEAMARADAFEVEEVL